MIGTLRVVEVVEVAVVVVEVVVVGGGAVRGGGRRRLEKSHENVLKNEARNQSKSTGLKVNRKA